MRNSLLAMRHTRSGVLFFIILLLAGGCGSSETPSSVTVTDDLNRTVHLQRPIERVVSLAPNLTELVYAAGGGNKLVAVTTADDYPPAVDTLTRVSALPVDFEAVTAAAPDLVLATDQVNPPGDTETFKALDLPVYFFSFSSLTDVFEGIQTMGTLLGTEKTASDTVRTLKRRLSTLKARTDTLSSGERPQVLVLIGDDTLYSFGKGSYVHRLVGLAGGRSITASIESSAPTLSEEYVLTEKPDVIVGAWGADYDPSRLLKLHPTWDVVPAVKNNRVYSLPPSLLLRPGPRLVQGARRMASLLHPSRLDAQTPDSTSVKSSANPAPTMSERGSR